jgi:hypothetical protein
MDFSALKNELADRGFAHLNSVRQGQYINWARAEMDETALWPYRIATATGAAPLTISDLGTIETVVDTANSNNPLSPMDYSDLVKYFKTLSTVGAASYYYLASSTQVAVYPTTATLSVRYFKVPADLSASSDTPLAPTRWHRLIVDIATRMAYRDNDNHAAAEAINTQIERDKMLMLNSLMVVQTEPTFLRQTGDVDRGQAQ